MGFQTIDSCHARPVPTVIPAKAGIQGRGGNDNFLGIERGFTLIEVLTAISILAIGMVGILHAYSRSVSAMETAQYNIDAAYLLKAVIGQIEEKSITDGGVTAGVSNGLVSSYPAVKMGMTRSTKWLWELEVTKTGFEVEVETAEEESDAAKTEAMPQAGFPGEDDLEEEEGYFLSEVKLTVVNPALSPSRRVSLVTYMEGRE